jgi:hypothetical protein
MLSNPPEPIVPVTDWKRLVMDPVNDITYSNSRSAEELPLIQGTVGVPLNPTPVPLSGVINNWLAVGVPAVVISININFESVQLLLIVHDVAPAPVP